MLGKFITVEGIDGSGKTTIITYIKEYLEKKNYNVIITREPGGTDISEKIRNIILFENIDSKTEVLLLAASRRQHIIDKILPELKKGSLVLCDRFLDSSIAYQAYGRGLCEKEIISINKFAIENLLPDATLYFDVEVEKGLSRTERRNNNNNLDKQKKDFYFKVKSGYDKLAKKFPNRIIKINANNDIDEVKKESIMKIEELLNKWSK